MGGKFTRVLFENFPNALRGKRVAGLDSSPGPQLRQKQRSASRSSDRLLLLGATRAIKLGGRGLENRRDRPEPESISVLFAHRRQRDRRGRRGAPVLRPCASVFERANEQFSRQHDSLRRIRRVEQFLAKLQVPHGVRRLEREQPHPLASIPRSRLVHRFHRRGRAVRFVRRIGRGSPSGCDRQNDPDCAKCREQAGHDVFPFLPIRSSCIRSIMRSPSSNCSVLVRAPRRKPFHISSIC